MEMSGPDSFVKTVNPNTSRTDQKEDEERGVGKVGSSVLPQFCIWSSGGRNRQRGNLKDRVNLTCVYKIATWCYETSWVREGLK